MNKPKSLYIHIPFCEKICDYCDFTKLQYFRKFAVDYLGALQKELVSYQIGEQETIYVGGGTPTSLEDDLFEALLKMIEPYSKGVIEYTFEANPESLSETKIKMLSQYGVNRVSIGVQSTDDEILKYVNRGHTFKEVVAAIDLLHKHGIHNINVDLILGLPHTSKKSLFNDLCRLTELRIRHISCYALTIHPHTVLYNKGFKEPDSDLMREHYDTIEKYFSDGSFFHYEISNYAKQGYESRHNLTYWRNLPYYGCGLGASGYIDDVRYKNTNNLTKYLKGNYVEEKEIVTLQDNITYQIMLNLRINEGIDLERLKNEFGYDLIKEKGPVINELINQGLLFYRNNHLCPTYEAMMISDQIVLKLI